MIQYTPEVKMRLPDAIEAPDRYFKSRRWRDGGKDGAIESVEAIDPVRPELVEGPFWHRRCGLTGSPRTEIPNTFDYTPAKAG